MNNNEKLFQVIKKDILLGTFGPSGSRFISLSDFTARYSCSRRDASKIYQMLSDEKLIRITGKHYYVTTGFCRTFTEYGKILASSRRNIFGVLVNDNSNPFFGQVINLLRDVAYSHGAQIIVAGGNGDPYHEEQLLDMFLSLNCSGVFTCILPKNDNIIKCYPLPIVSLGIYNSTGNNDIVTVDNYDAAKNVARYLVNHGCKSFAYIVDDAKIDIDPRYNGFNDYLASKNISLPSDNIGIISSANAAGDISRFTNNLFNRAVRSPRSLPLGIFCHHDIIAVSVERAVKNYRSVSGDMAKLMIPNDVMIIGFDDLPIASHVSPSLTTVSYRYNEIAIKAFDVMLDCVNNPDHVTNKYLIPSSLTVRDTTGTSGV